MAGEVAMPPEMLLGRHPSADQRLLGSFDRMAVRLLTVQQQQLLHRHGNKPAPGKTANVLLLPATTISVSMPVTAVQPAQANCIWSPNALQAPMASKVSPH
jgi:hypothetical protein